MALSRASLQHIKHRFKPPFRCFCFRRFPGGGGAASPPRAEPEGEIAEGEGEGEGEGDGKMRLRRVAGAV